MGLFYIQLISVHTICAQINSILQHQSSMPGSWEGSGNINTQLDQRKPPCSGTSWTNTHAMDCLPAMELARESSVGWRNTDSWYSEQFPHLKNYVSSSIYSDLRIKLNSCSLLDPWLLNQKQQRDGLKSCMKQQLVLKGAFCPEVGRQGLGRAL